ncbi:SoxR reducing system RseC family protein [Clostridium sp. WILCCON 0269]|uniref:SoxR reducing system RseC family protein n=1 Tax=Candidatus Clostridium eludens TaxID=3381663 RepID=A0ABW8SLK5_9CLOT
MKRESEGIVIETGGDFAKVRASRHGDCKNCGACPGDNATILEAKNPIRAEAGQHVILEMKEQNMVGAAFIVYIMPIIAVFLGVLVGTWISNISGYYMRPLQVIGGIVFFAISLIYIKVFDKATAKNDSTKPVIKRII